MELYADRLPHHRRTVGWLSLPLAVAFFIAGALGSTLLGKALHLTGPDAHVEHWVRSVYGNLSYGIVALIIFLWVWLFERRSLAAIGLNGAFLGRYLRGLLIGGTMMAALVLTTWALGGYTLEAPGLWRAATVAAVLPAGLLFAAFMIQGASEEIVFRGWQMQILASRWGLVWAVVLNAAVFTWLHAGNIKPAPELYLGLGNIFIDTLFISLYAAWEGSLWGVCAQHAIWNWLTSGGFGLDVSGTKQSVAPLIADLMPKDGAPWWLTGGSFGPEASVVMTAVDLIALAILTWAWLRRPPRGHNSPLAETQVAKTAAV